MLYDSSENTTEKGYEAVMSYLISFWNQLQTLRLADIFDITLDALFERQAPEKSEQVVEELPWPDDDNLRGVLYLGRKLIDHGTGPELQLSFREKVVGDVYSDFSVVCGDVVGCVDAGGNVQCGHVTGEVDAGNSVWCEDVIGDVDAGTDVQCGDVAGDVDAGTSVACCDVEGNVHAGVSVSCCAVGGSVDAGVRVNIAK